ncbi:teichoic acid transporter [Halorubrum sp. SD690R]|uniref:oligosaccharide flippase family protein n=1 Tax=Halorubrum sp. SD690R TaxID=2518117 RepID=UPI0010F9C908|nr:polysaccharide biosynthesis C-terminal domain-containing protein [Halorubrum sp. SD690R]TKX47744.1 teichoic acid transporter [Halorubrum sp. SD690R]
MRLAKTSIVVFTSGQFSTLVGFVATFYIASYLGPETLGAYSVAVGVLYWVYLPASAVDSAVNKRVSEQVDQGEILSAGALLNTVIALSVITCILLFPQRVESYVGHPVSIEMATLVFFSFAANFMSAVLHGQKKVAQASIIWTSGRVVRTGLQIGLTLLLGLGVSGLLWGHSLSFLVATAFAVTINSVRPTWPSREHFRRLFEYARYSWLGQLSVKAFNWLDTVILALFVSSTLIGIYQAAWTMASALSVVSSSIGTTLFPTFSELSTDNRYDEISELCTEGLSFAGIFMIPGLAGALTVGPRVLEIYGPEYGQGALILVLLVIARLTNAYNGLFKNTINAIDRPDIGFRINAVAVASNVALNFTLIPLFGWYGAAIGTTSSATIGLLFGYYWVNQIIPIRVPYREIGLQVVASSIMVLAVFGLSPVLDSGRIETVVLVLLAAGVYSIALLILSSTVRQKTVSILSDYPYFRALL